MRHFMENICQFILRLGIYLQNEKSNDPTNEAFFEFDKVLLGTLPL